MARAILLALFFLPGVVCAQAFKGGVQGGLSMSQVDGDRYAGFHKTGGWCEVFVEYPISKKTALHLGISGVQKGSYKEFSEQEFYRMSLIYAEVPVLVQYRIASKAVLEGGLGLGVLAYSKEETEMGPLSSIDSPAFNSFELSAQGGVKYFFWSRAGGAVKLSYSVLPIRDTKQNSMYRRSSGQFNNLIQLSLFYML